MLFRFDSVSKEFGAQQLFSDVTVQANPEDRIGLIGRNGSGKTTFLDLIDGKLEPDSGRVARAAGLQISRIRQIPRFDSDRTVRDEALVVFQHFEQWERRVRALEEEMAKSGRIDEPVADEYERLRSRLKLEGGYDYRARTEAVLLGLGFRMSELDTPCGRLSGGQISRLALARSLLRPADLLLLDEPTNHLDLAGILWLESHLNEQTCSFLLISHDRRFLDRVTHLTWEIENRVVTTYPCPFSSSRRQKRRQLQQRRKAYERQQEWKAKTEEYIRRNLYGQKTKQAQSRRKQLEKTEWIDAPPEEIHPPRLRIPEADRGGAISFSLQRAVVGYSGDPLIEDLNLTVHRGDRIAILGGNGSGKTTLLRTLQRRHPLRGGRLEWGPNVAAAFFSQNPRFGDETRTVYDFLRDLDLSITDEQLRSYAARFLFRGEEIFKPVERLSGGERSRLALARLFYSPCNVLVMDEPTNHLDIASRESLETALRDFEGSLVVVSHDLYFLEQVVDRFFLIRNRRLQPLTSLEELPRLLLDKSRTEQQKSESPPPAPRPRDASPGLSKNERRRRELRLQELEHRIESLETKRLEVLEAMQNGNNYAELQRQSARAETLSHQLEELYRQWEETAEELVE